LEGRPERHPGSFKTQANRVGATIFVAPDLVTGTLREGFLRLAHLDTAWERAVLVMFVVSEVHPFEDGNGRVARLAMNAELVAAHQSRIIVPTVYRDDYLGALRRLSRQDDPSVLIKALRYAQEWTCRIDFTDLEGARAQMESTNAFDDREGARLLLPPRRMFGEAAAIVGDGDEPSTRPPGPEHRPPRARRRSPRLED
jgi:hypothetical protein